MARVTVALPSLLSRLVGCEPALPVEARTLRAALDAAIAVHPALRVHLFDETGGFRRHVLCFHNDTNTRWLDDPDVPLADGDRVTIMQAVSGG